MNLANGRDPAVLRQIDRLFRIGTAAALSDGQLLERFSGRDRPAAEAAFEALLARHGPMVLGVCRRVLRDPQEAEDAFQATFLVLVRKANSVRVEGSLASWLYGVTRRIAVRAGETGARRRSREVADASRVADPARPDDPDLRDLLQGELDRLPERYRTPVLLCLVEGLTHEEAAGRLRWPIGTVKGRLSRARRLLRDRLARRGIGVSAGLLVSALAKEAIAVPTPLLASTTRAALGFLVRRSAMAGLASASAVALSERMLQTMLIAKFKAASAAVLIAFGVVAAGAATYGRVDSAIDGPETKGIPVADPETRPAADPGPSPKPDDAPRTESPATKEGPVSEKRSGNDDPFSIETFQGRIEALEAEVKQLREERDHLQQFVTQHITAEPGGRPGKPGDPAKPQAPAVVPPPDPEPVKSAPAPAVENPASRPVAPAEAPATALLDRTGEIRHYLDKTRTEVEGLMVDRLKNLHDIHDRFAKAEKDLSVLQAMQRAMILQEEANGKGSSTFAGSKPAKPSPEAAVSGEVRGYLDKVHRELADQVKLLEQERRDQLDRNAREVIEFRRLFQIYTILCGGPNESLQKLRPIAIRAIEGGAGELSNARNTYQASEAARWFDGYIGSALSKTPDGSQKPKSSRPF